MSDQELTIEVNVANLEELKELRKELEKIKEIIEEVNVEEENPFDDLDIDRPDFPKYPDRPEIWTVNENEDGVVETTVEL